jgi:hypothetical protein
MAEVVYSLLDRDLVIRPNIECVTLNRKFNFTDSKVRKIRKTLSNSSALELKLDTNELQELHAMCTRPANRNYITQLISQLITIQNHIPCRLNNNHQKEVRKWSDIVAGRSPQLSYYTQHRNSDNLTYIPSQQ